MKEQENRFINENNLSQAPSLLSERGSLRTLKFQERVEINGIATTY